MKYKNVTPSKDKNEPKFNKVKLRADSIIAKNDKKYNEILTKLKSKETQSNSLARTLRNEQKKLEEETQKLQELRDKWQIQNDQIKETLKQLKTFSNKTTKGGKNKIVTTQATYQFTPSAKTIKPY